MPVVIHSRESFDETLEVVKQYVDKLPGVVFHCFPGDVDDAYRVLDFGFVISVGGVVTFKNSRMSRVAAEIPLDSILIETDSPYLTPAPFRGKENQPAYIVHVCRKLAELRGISQSEVERVTDRASRKFYRLEETFEG